METNKSKDTKDIRVEVYENKCREAEDRFELHFYPNYKWLAGFTKQEAEEIASRINGTKVMETNKNKTKEGTK